MQQLKKLIHESGTQDEHFSWSIEFCSFMYVLPLRLFLSTVFQILNVRTGLFVNTTWRAQPRAVFCLPLPQSDAHCAYSYQTAVRCSLSAVLTPAILSVLINLFYVYFIWSHESLNLNVLLSVTRLKYLEKRIFLFNSLLYNNNLPLIPYSLNISPILDVKDKCN